MIDRNEFITIDPRLPDSQERTPLEDFIRDFRLFFPNFPEEIIEQWPYRHFDDFCGEYRWRIEYDRLSFHKELFRTVDFKLIQAESFSSKELLEWGSFQIGFDNWLSNYMKEKLKAPEPIIVLNTKRSCLDGEYDFKLPYHLLEGHRRTSFILALFEQNPNGFPGEQLVWMTERR